MKKINFSKNNITNLDIKKVKEILKSGWLTHGQYSFKFENEFKKFTNSNFSTLVSNCTAGLHLACKVLGLRKYVYFFKVIMPQMLRLAIPNLSNVWQITLKDTSLISVTGLVEIMRQSYIAAGSTRDPLFFYSFAALLYLILTFFSMKILNKLEKNYNRGF